MDPEQGDSTETVGLAAQAMLGPYRILAPLGSGGMGAVYKARDTRLDRMVAIKVLKPGAELESGRERLRREAKAVSRLAHPHICNLYDIGSDGGRDFLVMEFVDGVSLQQRLRSGPLQRAEFFQYAIEMADALDHAHRHGVIHRDLKPGNVMLTDAEGRKKQTKLLDFGLAALRAPVAAAADVTAESGITERGVILGTPQYMAPEQLSGSDADARSDIFAFGATLFEMATGRKPFVGKTWSELLAAINTGPRPSLGTACDPALERLITKCLATDPSDRWQTTRDLKSELEWLSTSRAMSAAPGRGRKSLWIGTTALLAILAFAAGKLLMAPRIEGPPVVRLALSLPEEALLTDPGRLNGAAAISPDGKTVVMTLGVGSSQALWIRRLDSDKFERLTGTEGAIQPFWSPNGREIGFFVERKLKKMAVPNGAPQELCFLPDNSEGSRGGAWNASGTILFGVNYVGLLRVSERGGESVKVAGLDEHLGENSLRFPAFLPDGNRFIYYSRTKKQENAAIYLDALDTAGRKPRKRLVAADGPATMGRDPTSGRSYLLYPSQGRLWAQLFDLTRGETSGEPASISADVGQFGVSATGVLVYRHRGSEQNRLTWVDRTGRELGTLGNAGDYWDLAIAPDGRHIAAMNHRSSDGHFWIDLIDVGRNLQATFSQPAEFSYSPVWSRDSKRVYFYSARNNIGHVFVKSVDDAGAEQPVSSMAAVFRLRDLSPDGHTFLTEAWNGATRILGRMGVGTAYWRPLFATSGGEDRGQFSPDGRWIAYQSNDTGTAEIYVTDFPAGRRRIQVSATGGTEPRWSGDNKELFYAGLDGSLMSAKVVNTTEFSFVAPVVLFKKMLPSSFDGFRYAVTRDGQRILLVSGVVDERSRDLSVVFNWQGLLHGERNEH